MINNPESPVNRRDKADLREVSFPEASSANSASVSPLSATGPTAGIEAISQKNLVDLDPKVMELQDFLYSIVGYQFENSSEFSGFASTLNRVMQRLGVRIDDLEGGSGLLSGTVNSGGELVLQIQERGAIFSVDETVTALPALVLKHHINRI